MMKRRHVVLIGVLAFVIAAVATLPASANSQELSFLSAKPIWPQGREKEINLFVGFRAVFEKLQSSDAVLSITGSSLYRIFLNGKFLGHGPARGPHGYQRLDQWPLKGLRQGKNVLAIEVAGYNANSYYLIDEPSFLQAEVVAGGKVLAATAAKGSAFEAYILKERLQKVQRYSSQRTFIEYYRLDSSYDKWRTDASIPLEETPCQVLESKKLLPRRVAYPEFLKRHPVIYHSRGTIETNVKMKKIWKGRELKQIGPKFKGYTEDELEVIPSVELQKIRTLKKSGNKTPYSANLNEPMKEKTFTLWDLGTNLTGFIGASIKCNKKTKLYITFDEILSKGDIDFKRLKCINAIGYELQPGNYSLESFEPYTMRYLKFIVMQGQCQLSNIYLREFVNPQVNKADFNCNDESLNKLYEAAKETFRQNALDIFMDCPSRERAGWLCDSFFTSRVAFDLSGNTTIEKNMFENYLLPESFKYLPEGMLPMCYPADHYHGRFIPNWAMWFVIELEEYLARSGDRQLVDALEPKVMALLKYFEPFKNEDGLLEKLDSWIFIEWSQANKFVQDISYPSNMCYASVLAAAGRIYDKPDLLKQAEKMREVIRTQSFDGEFFVDNAVRKNGKLQLTTNRSEVCQYFAFFFDVVTPDTHKELWGKLQKQFGPGRSKSGAFPQIHPANSLNGNYLRLELLSRYGYSRQLKNELIEYFLYMAENTGTLWEHVGSTASLNHGFASHVAHCLYRDVLGIYRIDTQKKTVDLRFADVGLKKCQGKMPTADGMVSLSWRTQGNNIVYTAIIPDGYALNIQNLSSRKLIRAQ